MNQSATEHQKLTYNEIAGGSLERITALSDGLFAIAMTLLVLDLKLPLAADIHSEHELAQGSCTWDRGW